LSNTAYSLYKAGNDPRESLQHAREALHVSPRLDKDLITAISELKIQMHEAELNLIEYQDVVNSFETYIKAENNQSTVYSYEPLITQLYTDYSDALLYSGNYLKAWYQKGIYYQLESDAVTYNFAVGIRTSSQPTSDNRFIIAQNQAYHADCHTLVKKAFSNHEQARSAVLATAFKRSDV